MNAGETFSPARLKRLTGGKVFPPAIVGRQRDIGDGPKRLFDLLYRRAGNNDACWPSFETCACDLGKGVRQIKADLVCLEALGFIRHRRRRRQSNVYEFRWHPLYDVQPTALQETQEVRESAHQDKPLDMQPTAHQKPLEVQLSAHQESLEVQNPGLDVQDTVSKKCSGPHTNTLIEVSHVQNLSLKGFSEFRSLYEQTAKPLNDGDWQAAAREGITQGIDTDADWAPVLEYLEAEVEHWNQQETEPRFIPSPRSLLQSKPWTRKASTATEASPYHKATARDCGDLPPYPGISEDWKRDKAETDRALTAMATPDAAGSMTLEQQIDAMAESHSMNPKAEAA